MRLAPLGTLQSQAGGGFASNKPPPGRCLAPMEAGTFASHCVRFIRCLAPIEAVERRALLATKGPPGRCLAPMEAASLDIAMSSR